LDSARKLTLRRLLTLENASMDKCNGFVSFFIAGALSAACSGGQAFTSGPADANGGGNSGSNGAIAGDAGMASTSASGAGASGEGGSDASAGAGEATGGDGGGTGGSGGLAAGAGAGGIGIGIGTAGTGMGTAGSNAGSGGATSASCPIPTGYYKMITIDGAGCGDLNASVPACTTAGGALCRYNIKSEGGKSVSGAIAVQADGSFQSATIQEGSVQRSGCQGTVTKGVLTIVCGGADPSSDQYCSATLTRTALLCP
jgi:hypothetical protein